jgi:hypothetical protein
VFVKRLPDVDPVHMQKAVDNADRDEKRHDHQEFRLISNLPLFRMISTTASMMRIDIPRLNKRRSGDCYPSVDVQNGHKRIAAYFKNSNYFSEF